MKEILLTKWRDYASWEGAKKLFFHTAAALSFTSGLSYIAGFVRDRILATTFGASETLDVYYAAFVVPDFILAIFVASSIAAAFVPLFVHAHTLSKKEASDYVYSTLSFLGVLVVGAAVLLGILIPYLTDILVPGFHAEQRELYIQMMRVMLFSPVIFLVSNVFGGVLLGLRDYFFYGLAPVFYNIGIIFGIMYFVPQFGPLGLAYGTVFGALMHMMSRLAVGLGRVGKPAHVRILSPRVRETISLMLPKIFQIIAWQILLLWFVRLSTLLEEGSVTVYNFARNFQSMPVSLIGIAIALSAFTTLSHISAKKDYRTYAQTLRRRVLLVLGLTVPIAVITAFIAPLLIRTLLGGGEFDEKAVAATALVLQVYALSIPLESLMHLLARAHYALKHTFYPSVIHIISIGSIIWMSWVWIERFGVVAIPLSFTLGLTLHMILLVISYYFISRRFFSLR